MKLDTLKTTFALDLLEFTDSKNQVWKCYGALENKDKDFYIKVECQSESFGFIIKKNSSNSFRYLHEILNLEAENHAINYRQRQEIFYKLKNYLLERSDEWGDLFR